MKPRSTAIEIVKQHEDHRQLSNNTFQGAGIVVPCNDIRQITVSPDSTFKVITDSTTTTATTRHANTFPTQTFDIIYADPPWKYNDPKGNNPSMGGITYQTMTLDDICDLPVGNIAKKDASLFLWATMPKLNEAFTVIEAWGFDYTTCAFVWVKQNPKNDKIYSGLGHWTNGNAELCLFAKKGKPKRVAKNVKQIVLAHRGRHSEKPPEIRNRIIELMGDLPKVELFARQRVAGWSAWGNEIK